ncbi:aminoglycoside phosphotransferase [Streptomyces tauricus]|uniref:aminoglycoside phosphotransferase n=1 Tax=Streptomyces TaxID=1883 RepID=UPI0033A46958
MSPQHRLTDLPADARTLIEDRTGPIQSVTMLTAGLNSSIAARLILADSTSIFVKGMQADHRWVWTQRREADINRHTRGLAPRVLWHVTGQGWDLLGFEHVDGVHADYRPGSAHLQLVLQAMWSLASTPAPSSVDLKTMPQRMSTYVDDPHILKTFAGSTLLHTDWKSDNVLITDGRARLVDWGWASRGAAWIDPALWVIWLIASGHTPQQAEAQVHPHPVWHATDLTTIDSFARAQARMWESIARTDAPSEWTHRMHQAAVTWAKHRQ